VPLAEDDAPNKGLIRQANEARILGAGERVFARAGFNGATMAAIADEAGLPKANLHYYFGSKEGLYIAVLEDAYRRMRSIESQLHLEDLPPEEALRRLVAFTFDHHAGNEFFIRLVMTENMERGAYLAQSKSIQELNVPAIQAIRHLYERGVAQGVFRPGLDPVDIHASISALSCARAGPLARSEEGSSVQKASVCLFCRRMIASVKSLDSPWVV